MNSCREVVSKHDSEKSRLVASDPKLFAWKANYYAFTNKSTQKEGTNQFIQDKKESKEKKVRYDSLCPQMPKKLTEDEFESNKESVEYGIRTGSDAKKCKENIYICPRFWCPKSRVSVSTKQCPLGEDEKVVESESYYPYFMKPSSHPRGLILPCCGKRNQNYKLVDKIADSAICNKEQEIKYSEAIDKKDPINNIFIKDNTNTYHLKEPSVETALISAFNLQKDPSEIVLEKLTIRDFLLVNAGYNLKAFYDPGMKQDENFDKRFDEFIEEKDTIEFIENFQFDRKEIGKIGTDSRQIMIIIYNALVNFREYIKSNVRKIFEDFIGFTHFEWFNREKLGVLFFEKSDDTKEGKNMHLKINVNKSAISPDFDRYCCFCEREGYVTPIFGKNSKNKNELKSLALIDTKIISKIIEKVTEENVVDHAENKIGKKPQKYVLDYNLKICGCVSEGKFVQFDKHYDIMINNEIKKKYIFISSLKKDTMLYEISSFLMPKDVVCSIASLPKVKVKDVLDDLYYLRHQLNPMLFQDKVNYLGAKQISKDLALCLLQVFDVDRLFEESLSSSESTTKKITYDPSHSDFAKIMSLYQNPYMNMFDTSLDDLDVDVEIKSVEIKSLEI